MDIFFFSSRRRHTRCSRDWSSDVCSSDLRINPATVIQAYRDLEAQGFVEIRHGAGTFVRELAPGRRARERSQQAVALVRKLLAEARRSGVSLAELQRALETELGAKTT